MLLLLLLLLSTAGFLRIDVDACVIRLDTSNADTPLLCCNCCVRYAAGFLSIDVDGRVIRLDTLSKLLGPGFRLGWLAGPPALAAKFALYTAGTSIVLRLATPSLHVKILLHQLVTFFFCCCCIVFPPRSWLPQH
jgi:hypothetical protein